MSSLTVGGAKRTVMPRPCGYRFVTNFNSAIVTIQHPTYYLLLTENGAKLLVGAVMLSAENFIFPLFNQIDPYAASSCSSPATASAMTSRSLLLNIWSISRMMINRSSCFPIPLMKSLLRLAPMRGAGSI